MTREQLKTFISENKETMKSRVNEYIAATGINMSEFTTEQQTKLFTHLFAVELDKMVK